LKPKTGDEIKKLNIGDLIQVDWSDASIGKSLSCGMEVDVPVSSWGIYLGLLGRKTKHIILVQNNFRYADGLFDLDYTAIPYHWGTKVTLIMKSHIQQHDAQALLNSFLMGGRRSRVENRTKQQHVSNHHDRLD